MITSVVQVLVNVLDFGMGIQEAIAAPRIHIEGSDPKVPEGRLVREMHVDSRIDPETVRALERSGHAIALKLDGDFALPVGILRDLSTGKMHGGVTVPVPAMAIGL